MEDKFLGIDTASALHEGWNTMKITEYKVAPGQNQDMTLFKVIMHNLHMCKAQFLYAVPEDRECHQILKDLHSFKKANNWVEAHLERNQRLEWSITGLREIRIPVEELNQLSLDVRNPNKKGITKVYESFGKGTFTGEDLVGKRYSEKIQ